MSQPAATCWAARPERKIVVEESLMVENINEMIMYSERGKLMLNDCR